MKFQNQLAAAVVCALLFVFAFAGKALERSRRQYEIQAALTTQNLAHTLSINVDGIIAKLEVGLFALAAETRRQIETGRIDDNALNAYLALQKARLRDFEGMWVADAKGDIRWGTELPAGRPVNIADREYFQRLKSGTASKVVLSKPVIGRVTKAWSMLIAERVDRADGSMAGVVLGSLNVVDYFNSLFSTIDVGPRGIIALRDDELALIARFPKTPDFDKSVGSKKVSNKTFEEYVANPSSGTYTTISAADGLERVFSFRKVPGYPLVVFVGKSREDYLAPWKKEAAIALWLLAMFIVAVIFSARILFLRTREALAAREIEHRKDALEREVKVRNSELEERRRIEAKLRESEVQYRNLANSGLALIWTAGTDKLCSYFNEPWLRFTGRTLEQERGDGWTKGVHPEDLPGCMKVYNEAFDGRRSFTMEYRLRHNSGEYRWIQDIGNPNFDGGGEFLGYIGHCFDITPRKQMELEKEKLRSQLLQSQKMESIGVLAGGIAHDFNNILSGILGYAEMARADAPAGSPVVHSIDQLVSSAQRAKDLVKHILTFSRQAPVERRPIRIQPLVKEAIKLLRASLPATIAIREDIRPEGGVLLGDPSHIHQIVMNLSTNAFHAMEHSGGVLTITLAPAVIGPPSPKDPLPLVPGDYVHLAVKDTGSGIPPEVLGRIFEPYFTTKEPGKGTGMGLSIVHGIAKSYGGAITVESAMGRGTTFHVYLRALSEAPAGDKPPAPAEAGEIPRGRERILFVDDEGPLLDVGKKSLERLGYAVTALKGGAPALEAFRKDPGWFDLVITDQTMPVMTGVEFAQQVQEIRPGMPIIVSTGFSTEIDETSAALFGIKGFLPKPYTRAALGSLVRKVLDAG